MQGYLLHLSVLKFLAESGNYSLPDASAAEGFQNGHSLYLCLTGRQKENPGGANNSFSVLDYQVQCLPVVFIQLQVFRDALLLKKTCFLTPKAPSSSLSSVASL